MKINIEFDLEDKFEAETLLNGHKYKLKIDTLYDEVFRPHLKYNKPLLPESHSKMKELTEDQILVIEQIWENVLNHFEDCI